MIPKTDLVKIIIEVASEEGLDPRELLMLGLAESNLVSDAFNPSDGKWGSVGFAQQMVEYAPEFTGPDSVEAVRSLYLNNPRHAAQVAVAHYLRVARQGDSPVDVACRYNGATDPQASPVRWLYQRSWERAQTILEEPNMAQFVLGFKTLADRLGKDVVGEPQEDQDYQVLKNGGEIAYQFTDKGFMVYSKKANRSFFVPGLS